jgi:hypothetical protein
VGGELISYDDNYGCGLMIKATLPEWLVHFLCLRSRSPSSVIAGAMGNAIEFTSKSRISTTPCRAKWCVYDALIRLKQIAGAIH